MERYPWRPFVFVLTPFNAWPACSTAVSLGLVLGLEFGPKWVMTIRKRTSLFKKFTSDIFNFWEINEEQEPGRALDIVDQHSVFLFYSFWGWCSFKVQEIGISCAQESVLNQPSLLEVVSTLGNGTNLPLTSNSQKPKLIYNSFPHAYGWKCLFLLFSHQTM